MNNRELKAEELFKSGKNCSQAVFLAFADKYGLSDDVASKISCGLDLFQPSDANTYNF